MTQQKMNLYASMARFLILLLSLQLLLAFLVKRIWIYTGDGGVLSLGKLYEWFSRDIWDYLLVSMNGLNAEKVMLNVPLWTISAMLICELLIWGLYRWNKQLFRTVLAPAAILFVLGYWRNSEYSFHQKGARSADGL